MRIIFINIFLISFVAVASKSEAQIQVKGTVWDSSGMHPVQAVSVLSSRGIGTFTDVKGSYSLELNSSDSIWFSYLNKPTKKFAVKDIKTPYAFHVAIQTYVIMLPEARIRSRDYREDSLKNRMEYAKIFNYQKPGLSVRIGSGSVGLGLEDLINTFRINKTRSALTFQHRLIRQEEEGFVKFRFSKLLIRRITQENSDSVLTAFMALYEPTYAFAKAANDYVFHKYIKDSYDRFRAGHLPSPLWRNGEIVAAGSGF